MNKLYTLQKGQRTLSVWHKRKEYLVAFNKVAHARNVQYSIHMEPKMILLRDTNIDLHGDFIDEGYDMHLILDVHSTLFIPKNRQRCVDSIMDGCITMTHVNESEFLQVPLRSNNGIIVPYALVDETDDEFMFKSYVIDPLQNFS